VTVQVAAAAEVKVVGEQESEDTKTDAANPTLAVAEVPL